MSPSTARERNWLPLIIAACAVVIVAVIVVVVLERGKPTATVSPVSAAADPYATSLPISALQMSEAGKLAGRKGTYLGRHISHKGRRAGTRVSLHVLFPN